MKILLIGNGFDRAHNLPTNYSDFLDFCKKIENVYGANALIMSPGLGEKKATIRFFIIAKMKMIRWNLESK